MKYTLTLLAFVLSTVAPAFAASDYFLVTPLDNGCATNIAFSSGTLAADPISSFTFGGTDAVSATGNSSGQLSLQNFVISKGFDNCSGALATAFLTSAPLATVTLYARKAFSGASSSTAPYLGITLKNARITQYSLLSASESPVEQITFTFSSVAITAIKENPTTGASALTAWSYEISSNRIFNISPDPIVQVQP